MGFETKIEWCDHTWNPWIGCTKVDSACKNCYAETLMDKRWGKVKWGPNGTRTRTSESNWRQPLTWNAKAKAAGEMREVFCASLADIGEDRDELKPWRRDLCELIERCRHLHWQLLTKRPENMNRLIGDATGRYAHAWLADNKHVWIGASAGDQAAVDRVVPELLKINATVRFLSLEPLLDTVEFGWDFARYRSLVSGLRYTKAGAAGDYEKLPGIDWIIVGGESGPGARGCNVRWIRDIVKQCQAAEVPVFVKQLGANVQWDGCQGGYFDGPSNCWPEETKRVNEGGYFRVLLKDSKGGSPEEWPEDLCVRQMPAAKGKVTA